LKFYHELCVVADSAFESLCRVTVDVTYMLVYMLLPSSGLMNTIGNNLVRDIAAPQNVTVGLLLNRCYDQKEAKCM
jgi:hypothetical protein